jgi:hypothetical protein
MSIPERCGVGCVLTAEAATGFTEVRAATVNRHLRAAVAELRETGAAGADTRL